MHLTIAQAVELAEARRVLKAIQAETTRVVIETDPSPMLAFNIGKLQEAADAAEEAVFNVLNTASAYLGDPAAKRAIALGQPQPAGQ